MSASTATAADRCPRCGGTFHCGAAGPRPCPCTGVDLGAALQARLRQQFDGCLCGACLRVLNLADIAEAAATPGGAAAADQASETQVQRTHPGVGGLARTGYAT